MQPPVARPPPLPSPTTTHSLQACQQKRYVVLHECTLAYYKKQSEWKSGGNPIKVSDLPPSPPITSITTTSTDSCHLSLSCALSLSPCATRMPPLMYLTTAWTAWRTRIHTLASCHPVIRCASLLPKLCPPCPLTPRSLSCPLHTEQWRHSNRLLFLLHTRLCVQGC